jgi:hypothetical protein
MNKKVRAAAIVFNKSIDRAIGKAPVDADEMSRRVKLLDSSAKRFNAVVGADVGTFQVDEGF